MICDFDVHCDYLFSLASRVAVEARAPKDANPDSLPHGDRVAAPGLYRDYAYCTMPDPAHNHNSHITAEFDLFADAF